MGAVSSFANVAGGGTGTGANVTVTDNGSTVVLANGIVSITIVKSSGTVSNFTYSGTNLLSGGNGGGSFYFDDSGGPTLANPTYTLTVNPASNGGNQAEVMLQTIASPMDMTIYYDLLRGQQGIYDTVIFTHESSYVDYPGAELRSNMYVGSIFDWLVVDPYRFRQLAPPSTAVTTVPGAPQEVMQYTAGPYNGLTNCKYSYSDPLGELNTWGWASSTSNFGVWQTVPSHEYYDGGPMHRELTEHVGNTLLDMFGGGHYGFGLTQDQPAGSFSSKTIGPAFIYANQYTGSSSDPVSMKARALWADAQAQAAAEQGAWPYKWFNPATVTGGTGSPYPQASGRATVSGTLAINDPYKPGTSPVSLWIGLAPVDGGVDFQQQYLTYQFWVQTGSGGSFSIPNVLPGTYNLWAFGPGVVGTFEQANVTVAAGQSLNMGTLTWSPLRLGPTVWEIGTPDRNSNEFNNGEHQSTPYSGVLPAYAGGPPYDVPSAWGAFMAYPAQYPNGVSFVVGTSDPGTDWNYCQPDVASGTSFAGSTSKIFFNLATAPSATQTARLYIAFASAFSSACILTINGTVQTASVMGSTDGNYSSIANATTGFFPPNVSFDSILRLGSQGSWGDAYLDFAGNKLKAGTNEIDIGLRPSGGAGIGNGFEYDYVRMELTGFATPTPTPGGSNPTATFSPTRTNTPVPPTATITATATKTATMTSTNSSTGTPTASPTRTAVPPTATFTSTTTATFTLTHTNTPVPPTSTNTPVPPTSTFTASSTPSRTPTPVPPTSTNTPVPPTFTFTATLTRTNTAIPTSTNTSVPPTFTNTPLPPTSTSTATASRTNTSVPPTMTDTATSVPPTSTLTPVPPTATLTAMPTSTLTLVPPTASSTNSPVPPTATSTSTSAPPTATLTSLPTSTSSPVPPTASSTNSPVPPTTTFTSTPVPPTATSSFTASATPTASTTPTSSATLTASATASSTPTATLTPSWTPSASPTRTQVPATATSTATHTPVPPTATGTNTLTSTATAVPPTHTFTSVPPTSTATPLPPTVTFTPSPTDTTGVLTTSFKVQLLSGVTSDTTNSPHPQIQVVNTGTAPLDLNNVTVKYWFNCDCTTQTLQAWVDWAGLMPLGSTVTGNVQVSVQATSLGGQTDYVLYSFTGSMVLQPGQSIQIQSRFNKSDWSNMTQSNDWSFSPFTSFTDWVQVTGYLGGSLVWGEEPVSAPAALAVTSALSFPNPSTGSGATLSFNLNGTQTGPTGSLLDSNHPLLLDPNARITLGIYTTAMRLIWSQTLTGGAYGTTGNHQLYWNERDRGGAGLSNGVYLLRVMVESHGQRSTAFAKILILQ